MRVYLGWGGGGSTVRDIRVGERDEGECVQVQEGNLGE